MLKINVSTAEAVITETELITSGRKGLRCAFTFSDDWAGLTKTVIVQGAATRDIALLATNEITVPAECVNKAQFPLKIGVYGARPDGSIAIPTIWASFGKVLPGAKPSLIPPDELTPDVVAQIQEAANNALYLARNVQSMADSGALDGVSPAVTVTSITGGHNVKITDRDHPDGQDFDVPDGQDGADGVSPTISSESITGGHRLTIVDAGGTTTVDVMDGEDGADGSGVWYTTERISSSENPFVRRRDLIGREGATVQVHDLLYAPDVGDEGEPTTLYSITSVGTACKLNRLCKMQGEDGTSPTVTITEITGGHRITITDEAHPDGQSFDVMDGQGGGGGITVDDEISTTSENPVQNKVIALALSSKADASAIQQSVVQYISQTLTNEQQAQARENIGAASIEDIPKSGGLIEDIKQALLQIAQKVAYIDDQGQTYYQDLYDALYPPKAVVLITAVFEQGSTVIYDDTALDDLKQYLTVTAKYDDNTTAILADSAYTLSGLLEAGTSTVTVAYNGLTTTFTVNVTARPTLSSITAVYTQSGTVYTTDTLDSLKADLVVTAHYSDSSTAIVPAADYTLSGTLTAGTSTITVSYDGKTTTFTVTVTDGSVLPAGYEEVDSICNPIGSASGPYLDTGLTLSGTGDVVVDISFMSYGGETNQYVMGCLSSDSANTIGLGISIQSDYSTIIVFPGTVTSIAPSVVRGVKHNITATVTSTGATITDGTLTDSQTFTPRVHNVAPLYLFGIKKYNSTNVNLPFTGRIYSCVVTEGGVKKLDLVPCVRTSDGMAGFYDLVAETFIGNSALVAVPKNVTDTTAQIRSYGKIYTHHLNDPKFTESDKTNGCTTALYDMNAPTTTLFPAGIIPTLGTTVIATDEASLFVYDASSEPVSYANETNRWAQNIGGTMTEFSNSWTISAGYSKIAFSLDVRYLDGAYMYDKTTGQIWFAGAATPYYGMSNISEAQ